MTVVEVNQISKSYQLGVLNKSSALNKVKSAFGLTAANQELFHALTDVSFKVNQGDVLGVVGKNGAGKSTLLKVISRITAPSSGSIKIKGTVASLLEVGTGFHPELTGAENIFLNGAILGLSKRDIQQKFDEIVDFAGVGAHLQTPVKRYSSGMYVRLAFAIAAHLEPEILIVDEVLAVGDAEFQKKCLGKMKTVASEGRTVLFVSHNLTAVKSLCSRAILLEKGQLVLDGTTESIIERYNGVDQQTGNLTFHQSVNSFVQVERIGLKSEQPNISCEKSFSIEVELIKLDNDSTLDITIQFYDELEQFFMTTSTAIKNTDQSTLSKSGKKVVTLNVPAFLFNQGIFTANFLFVKDENEVPLIIEQALSFSVAPESKEIGGWFGKTPCPIRWAGQWKIMENQ